MGVLIWWSVCSVCMEDLWSGAPSGLGSTSIEYLLSGIWYSLDVCQHCMSTAYPVSDAIGILLVCIPS